MIRHCSVHRWIFLGSGSGFGMYQQRARADRFHAQVCCCCGLFEIFTAGFPDDTGYAHQTVHFWLHTDEAIIAAGKAKTREEHCEPIIFPDTQGETIMMNAVSILSHPTVQSFMNNFARHCGAPRVMFEGQFVAAVQGIIQEHDKRAVELQTAVHEALPSFSLLLDACDKDSIEYIEVFPVYSRLKAAVDAMRE